MNNVINLMQKMKEKETINNDNRHIELLEKAVSSLSYNEQLEFKKLYDEREKQVIEIMSQSIKVVEMIEEKYTVGMGELTKTANEIIEKYK